MSMWFSPDIVTFAGNELTHVRHVEVQAIPFDPNASLSSNRIMGFPPSPADVQIETRVERDVVDEIAPFDLPMTMGTLTFEVALGRSDGYRQRISLQAELAWSTLIFDRNKPARHVIRFLTISTGGNIGTLFQLVDVKPINI